MAYIRLGGKLKWENLFYKKVGKGEKNVLFLHGWGGSYHSFSHLASYLDDTFTSYLLDLPGFGSSFIDKPYNLDDYAKNVNDFIVANGITNPLVIGHSFGGRIALKMAELFKYKTILISTPIYDSKSLKTRIKILCNKLFKLSYPSNDYINASPVMRIVMKNVFNDMKRIDYRNVDGTKVLIIYATKDKIVPKRVAYYGKRKIKGSGIISINGDHFAYLKESFLLSKVILSYVK